jgi:hypothetical protein
MTAEDNSAAQTTNLQAADQHQAQQQNKTSLDAAAAVDAGVGRQGVAVVAAAAAGDVSAAAAEPADAAAAEPAEATVDASAAAAAAGSLAQQDPQLAHIAGLLLQLLLSLQQAHITQHLQEAQGVQHEIHMRGCTEAVSAALAFLQQRLTKDFRDVPVLHLWRPIDRVYTVSG